MQLIVIQHRRPEIRVENLGRQWDC